MDQPFGGYPGDIPVAGDWTGDGIVKIGIYRQGQWYLDKNGNGAWDGCEVDICLPAFGGYPGDIPVAGDWTGDGIAKIGIYRQGQWYLDKMETEHGTAAKWTFVCPPSAATPETFRWPETGPETESPKSESTARDNGSSINGNGAWDGCATDTCYDSFGGLPVDKPVVGDWTGDGITKVGIYQNGAWYLDRNGNGRWNDCGVDICMTGFGGLGEDIPLAK